MNHRNVLGENDHQVSAIVVSSEKKRESEKRYLYGSRENERSCNLPPIPVKIKRLINGENVSFVLIDRLFSADLYKKLDSW